MIAFAYAVRGSLLLFLLLNLFYIVYVWLLYRRTLQLVKHNYGLQSTHVFLMGLGLFVLQLGLAWTIGSALRSNPDPDRAQIVRICIYTVGSFLTLTSLMLMVKIQKVRVFALTNTTKE